MARRIKLERFDLWRYFRCGAFGDDAPDRNALVPVALERAVACGMPSFAPADVIVVGDTPNDVACAQAVGRRARRRCDRRVHRRPVAAVRR